MLLLILVISRYFFKDVFVFFAARCQSAKLIMLLDLKIQNTAFLKAVSGEAFTSPLARASAPA
jgi:hypothetical protein